MPASARIARRLARGELGLATDLDLKRRAVARIDAPHGREPIERLTINVATLGLLDDLTIPSEPKPLQVVLQLRGELGLAALGVGIFDAQQEATAISSCEQPVKERRSRIAQMQFAARTRGETGGRRHLLG